MRRRTLLLGATGAATGALMSSCQSSKAGAFRVEYLNRSIPPQVLKAFRRKVETDLPIVFDSDLQQVELYQKLQQLTSQEPDTSYFQTWLQDWLNVTPTQPNAPDLVSLGDYWLPSAIQQGLIQPLAIQDISQWQQLPEEWQTWVERAETGQLSPTGDVWGAPYRVQSLMLVYSNHLLKRDAQPPMRWSDLWLPEFKGRIAVPNHPRIVISLVLKVLGHSINDVAKLDRPEVQEQFHELYKQVKVFDSETYLKALINEDIWLAVGWSGDILATLARYRRLQAQFPKEGTVLTSDVWVKPKNSVTEQSHLELSQDWINFCWDEITATRISIDSHGVSPIFLGDKSVPDTLTDRPLLVPSKDILAKSERLQPLSSEEQADLNEKLTQIQGHP